MSTKREQLDIAAQLGAAAFTAGVNSAPAHDPAVLAMLSGRHVLATPEGEASTGEILAAWSRAWHEANANAPVFTADDMVSSYSRAQALEDGVLVDVTNVAREAGFRVPVALSAAVWADCVAWSDDDNRRKRACQDEQGRLWDVLWMAKLAARRNSAARLAYEVLRVPREGKGLRPRPVRLTMQIGPGDTPEPVITITAENED